jgi:transcriptional regulator with XRE-family HTH domain
MTDLPDAELTPGAIRYIRKARGETKAAFGDAVGVTGTTIQNWEDGASSPTPANRESVLALVPDGVDIGELPPEGAASVIWSDEVAADEAFVYSDERIQKLRAEPLPGSELDGGLNAFSAAHRAFVKRLQVTAAQGQANRIGDVEKVYYLTGDERRAVRRFIEVNEGFVREALAHRSNKLSSDWSDFLYTLLQEEWRFHLAHE